MKTCCGSSTRTGTYGYEPYEMPFLQSAVHRIMRDSCQHAGLRSSPSLAVFTIDQIASDLGGYDALFQRPLSLQPACSQTALILFPYKTFTRFSSTTTSSLYRSIICVYSFSSIVHTFIGCN